VCEILEGDEVVGNGPVDKFELVDGLVEVPLISQKPAIGDAGRQIVGVELFPVPQKFDRLGTASVLDIGFGQLKEGAALGVGLDTLFQNLQFILIHRKSIFMKGR
jgi:hypothetical protein